MTGTCRRTSRRFSARCRTRSNASTRRGCPLNGGELWLGRVGGQRTRGHYTSAVLLAVDVGNTNIALGLYEGERLVADWRTSTHMERTADEVGMELVQLFALRGRDLKEVSG